MAAAIGRACRLCPRSGNCVGFLFLTHPLIMRINTDIYLSSQIKLKAFNRIMYSARERYKAKLISERISFHSANPTFFLEQYHSDTIQVPMRDGSWAWMPTSQFAAEQDADLSFLEYEFTLGMKSKTHIFLQGAIDVIKHIKITDPSQVLRKLLPEDLDHQEIGFAFNFGVNKLVKCSILNGMLTILCFSRKSYSADVELTISTCHLWDLEDCEWDYAQWLSVQKKSKRRRILNESLLHEFINTIVFLYYTQPETIFVAAKNKVKAKDTEYYNNTPSDVILVDSTWNKLIIRTEGFGVTGHFRLQPHGEKSQLRKLIWVQPFQKHGYVRKPKSQSTNQTPA
jgi:hypothetical protein